MDVMKSLWNPNRFLRSINQQHWGNPQPTKTMRNAIIRRAFNSTRRKGRVVHPFKIYIPKSSPFWRTA